MDLPALEEISHLPMDEQLELNKLAAQMNLVPEDMQLKWDTETETLSIGKAVYKEYFHFKNSCMFVRSIFVAHGITDIPNHPKYFNKLASSVVRGSVPMLFKMFKGAQYKYFVAPHLDIIRKVCWKPGMVDALALPHVRKHRALLREVYDDKLYNILPVVTITGKSPKELKKEYGAAWKTLANNSLHKNKALVRNCCGSAFVDTGKNIAKLSVRAHLPTTVLKVFPGEDNFFLEHVAKYYKGEWTTSLKGKDALEHRRKWEGISNLFYDTFNMAQELRQKFDHMWTPRKLKEKHDQFSKDIFAKNYSKDKIEWLKEVIQSYEYEGYTATVVESCYDIAMEGNEMGHCVGSYAGRVANKDYLVYAVSKGGIKTSTLGIYVREWNIDEKGHFMFSQHYGKYNTYLKDEHEKQLGLNLIKLLNGEQV